MPKGTGVREVVWVNHSSLASTPKAFLIAVRYVISLPNQQGSARLQDGSLIFQTWALRVGFLDIASACCTHSGTNVWLAVAARIGSDLIPEPSSHPKRSI